jgi:hypothetical protein
LHWEQQQQLPFFASVVLWRSLHFLTAENKENAKIMSEVFAKKYSFLKGPITTVMLYVHFHGAAKRMLQ